MSFTIGSLFDGSGGFPLSASLCGGIPKWASEVEPYPIAVTKSRFPTMKHLGSVTDIKGGEVEPVDIITFGSPCQDLSVAGKRAGLKHEANGDDETTRSGLFMEAVRIIKEMREATDGVYPRFALWENVPGAFSSNNGEDFRIVLEELIKIVEPKAVMPAVSQAGWAYSDSYCGDGWSLAYRVLDAQYWGVPQRRRRIYLVADFRGVRAREVLFEHEGLRGYFAEGRTPRQTVAETTEGGSGAADCEGKCYGIDHAITTGGNCTAQGTCVYKDVQATLKACGDHAVAYSINHQGGNVGQIIEDKVGTLTASMNSSGNNKLSVAYSFDALASNSMKSGNPHSGCRQVDVAKCLDTTDPNPCKNQGGIAIVEQVPYLLKIRSGCEGGGKGALVQKDMSATLATNNDQYLFQPVTLEPGIASREGGHIYENVCGTLRANAGDNQMAVAMVDSIGGQAEYAWEGNHAPCLKASHYKFAPVVAYSVEKHPADSRVNIDESGKVQTLTSRMGTGGGNVPMVMEQKVFESHPADTPLVCESIEKHPYCKSARGKFKGDAETWIDGKVANTLNTFDQGEVRANELVVEEQPVYCLQGNGIDRADTAGCNGKDVTEDISYTLNTVDRHAVTYCTDVGFWGSIQNVSPTLLARQYKDPHLVSWSEGETHYIVRRLTPTECARLQGFPDKWGHPDWLSEDTQGETAEFWREVYLTDCNINEKKPKPKIANKDAGWEIAVIRWYNSLHTDSSEYKMWGNGIALPCALYVMQGIGKAMADQWG